MLDLDLINLLKQLEDILKDDTLDIPALERVTAQISSMINDDVSLLNDSHILDMFRLIGKGINRLGLEKARSRREKVADGY